jgi:hypothetical protein
MANSITWADSVLPIVVLATLAVVVPWVLVKRDTRSQREVAVTIWASAGVLMIASGVIYAVLHAAQGRAVGEFFAEAPMVTLWFFIKQAGSSAILWAPILALVWFGMAQGVEKRKGEDAAKR